MKTDRDSGTESLSRVSGQGGISCRTSAICTVSILLPRGNIRMAELGMQIAQQYLRPTDKLIGVIGDAGSGKSMLVKGMFPGLELTNDDEGVNVRPLPLLEMAG